MQAQGKQEDEYDDPDPWTGFEEPGTGPDSAAVTRLLSALAASDPMVCRLAVRSVGNNWQWDGDDEGMLGETHDEVLEAIQLLRAVGVDFLTLGQYLRPSENHAPVREYVEPARFADLQVRGEKLGFRYVAAGPLVRCSYKAGEYFFERMVRERQLVNDNRG